MSAGTHLFWITSRAAGITALLLASVAVGVGLAISNRPKGARSLGLELRTIHEALSLAVLAAVALHGLALLGDSYINASIKDISVPFTIGYRPFWTGLGIIGGWGLALLGLSYYARGRIGQARWKKLHRFTALFWILGIAHSLGAGTDARQAWFLVATGMVVVPALILLIARISAQPTSPSPGRASGASSVPAPASAPMPSPPLTRRAS